MPWTASRGEPARTDMVAWARGNGPGIVGGPGYHPTPSAPAWSAAATPGTSPPATDARSASSPAAHRNAAPPGRRRADRPGGPAGFQILCIAALTCSDDFSRGTGNGVDGRSDQD